MSAYVVAQLSPARVLERMRGIRAGGKRPGGSWVSVGHALVVMVMLAIALAASGTPATASGQHPVVRELATFAAPGCAGGCGSGSTVGPDKALYVTDGPGGRVLRVDPTTGAVTSFASGLPRTIPEVGIGGAMDVAFLGGAAYVLVTLGGPEFGQPDVVNGVYRIDPDGGATAIADIGAWSVAHPPETDFFVPSGVQYALERFHGGLLVSDGHHNRGAARLAGWRHPSAARVRQRSPDGTRDRRQEDLHGTGRPHPASS